MRNIFDQYSQTENRLTHALVWTLKSERRLIRPFLSWIGLKGIPPTRLLHITEQQIPGAIQVHDEQESSGLPDAIIYTDDGWAVLIESKVEASPKVGQLRRHRDTAQRHGFDGAQVVLLTVENPRRPLPDFVRVRDWREVYAWFRGRAGRTKSDWPLHLTEFIEFLESQAEEGRVKLKGTLTMFDGFRFDQDHPYAYGEAKRLLRLFRAELINHKELLKMGIDPKAPGRVAIKGRGQDYVWDIIRLRQAAGHAHTDLPHLTIGVNRGWLSAAVTIPNRIKGGFQRKLRALGLEDFTILIQGIERNLRPLIKRSKGAKPTLLVLQRHYLSQSSPGIVDGRLEFDLRTCVESGRDRIRYQPNWVQPVYKLMSNKRGANIQLIFEVRFEYSCPKVRSSETINLFADAWKAMWPVVDLVIR